MNRSLTTFLAVLSLVLCTPHLFADLADIIEKRPLTPGPVINRAPEFAKWTISFAYPKGENDPQSPHRLQTLTITKTKDVYYEVRMYSDGSHRESWHIGNLQISAVPGSHNYAIYEPSSFGNAGIDPSLYTDYSTTDFPAFAWVSPANYQGVLNIKKADQLIFQQSLQSLVPEMGFGVMLLTACIDLRTHLPIWVQSRDATLTYQFKMPPSASLNLPAEVRQILEKRDKAVQSMTSTVPSF